MSAGEALANVSALFAWPQQAAVGRVLPKTKIYAHARPGPGLRARFVAQVEQIVWACKLAPESINLPAAPAVPEIEVFQVVLKTPALDDEVLRCIDRAIPFPTLFELQFAGRTQPVAAFKRPSDNSATQWVTGEYFAGAWQPEGVPRPGLPLALDLPGLYEQLLRAHIPLPARDGESLREQVERFTQIRSAQVEQRQLAARLTREPQFHRKVELNAKLRTIRTRLATLSQ